MNALHLRRALMAPWMASQVAVHWLVGVTVVACVLLCLSLGMFDPSAQHNLGLVFTLLPAVALVWMFFLPNLLLLTRQARSQCIPGVQRDVRVCLLANAALTTVLPALLLGLDGVPVVPAMLVLALSALGGLLYATLPLLLAMMVAFVPALVSRLVAPLHLATINTPGYLHWAVPLVGALLLLAIVRWRQLARHGLYRAWLSRPVLAGFSAHLRASFLYEAGLAGTLATGSPSQWLRQRPAWLQALADLRRTGPDQPVRSLRVALGAFWMPKMPASVLREWAVALMFLAPSILFSGYVLGPSHHQDAGLDFIKTLINQNTIFFFLGALALSCMLIPLSMVKLVQIKWQHVNSELPMLALMPGLGTGAQARHHLLRAVMGRPMLALLVLWLLMLILGVLAHLSGLAMLSVGLVAPMIALLTVTGFMLVLGQVPWRHVRSIGWLVLPAAFILAMLGATLPWAFHDIGISATSGKVAMLSLCLGWLMVAVLTLRAAYIGWRAYHQLPHPYVVHSACD